MTLIPSPEQQLCIDATTGTSDNLLITACAGGAKTTTMCQIARAVGPGKRIVALAFNKDAATSLAAKMPYYVESKTFHSFCYDALGTALRGKPRPDSNRCKWFLKDLMPDWKQRTAIESDVLTLVSRFKSTTATPGEQNLQVVADDFGIDVSPSIIALAKQVLDKCLEQPFKSIDFDDMLWLAYHLNVAFPMVSLILLDEAQDTNPVQRALLERMLNMPVKLTKDYDPETENRFQPRSGRLIAVGDPHQSIYGFRGASANAMEALREDFAMTPLALSVSYRCSQAVVMEAQKYAGESIQPRADAPLGSVTRLHSHSASDFTLADCAGLCRNTTPLIEFALSLLRRGVACHVVGKDIQIGLDRLIDKCNKSGTMSEFRNKLIELRDTEFSRLKRKGKAEQAASFADKCDALLAIAAQAVSPTDIKTKLSQIFANGDGITLSTIHKAKGLEWTTVFLLDWHLLPSKYAETADALTQERNLQYVAVTRAKLDLKFINSENWRD